MQGKQSLPPTDPPEHATYRAARHYTPRSSSGPANGFPGEESLAVVFGNRLIPLERFCDLNRGAVESLNGAQTVGSHSKFTASGSPIPVLRCLTD